MRSWIRTPKTYHPIVGFLRGGCSRGGGNWGTLRIPTKDWGTLGNVRGIWNHHPPLRILLSKQRNFSGGMSDWMSDGRVTTFFCHPYIITANNIQGDSKSKESSISRRRYLVLFWGDVPQEKSLMAKKGTNEKHHGKSKGPRPPQCHVSCQEISPALLTVY